MSFRPFRAGLSLALLAAGPALALDLPPDDAGVRFQDGVLTLPAVHTAEQPGRYLDVSLLPRADGLWQVRDYLAVNEGARAVVPAPVTRVDPVRIDGAPAQVLLRVQGSFGSGCGSPGLPVQRRLGRHFEVFLPDAFTAYAVSLCAAVLVPYVKSVPLAVYGLPAGTYTYAVNGVRGSFELAADNLLAGDCVGSACAAR